MGTGSISLVVMGTTDRLKIVPWLNSLGSVHISCTVPWLKSLGPCALRVSICFMLLLLLGQYDQLLGKIIIIIILGARDRWHLDLNIRVWCHRLILKVGSSISLEVVCPLLHMHFDFLW
jgi:hypothetical protein